jgi:hypothetical protein
MGEDLGHHASTLAVHGARLDGHDGAIIELRAADTRIESNLSDWLKRLDGRMWAIVIGVAMCFLGLLGTAGMNYLVYTALHSR